MKRKVRTKFYIYVFIKNWLSTILSISTKRRTPSHLQPPNTRTTTTHVYGNTSPCLWQI